MRKSLKPNEKNLWGLQFEMAIEARGVIGTIRFIESKEYELGRSDYAVVYSGILQTPNNGPVIDVAIKRIKRCEISQFEERFMANIGHHSNILLYYGTIETNYKA